MKGCYMLKIFTATALILVLVLPGNAEARHRHHRHHHARAIPVAAPELSLWSLFQGAVGGGDVVSIAKAEVGNGAIYGRRSLWCARFMNTVLQRAGYRGTGSDMARSFAHLPRTTMQVGALAVMSRRRGGHVGVVTGIDPAGNPIVVSGNHRHRVAESVYPRSQIYAYVMPQ